MKKLYEFIPNISTCCEKVLKLFEEAFTSVKEVKLLNYSSDTSHNRAVFTCVGTEDGLLELVDKIVIVALNNIDMRKHKGVHPRLGAIDVMPFTPYKNCTMDDAIELSLKVSNMIFDKYSIPVYLYENSQKREYRKNLADIRKGEFENLNTKIKDPLWTPDFFEKLNPTFGCVCVGARNPLIAYNININTKDIDFTKTIASKLREKDGGLKGVKALGLQINKANHIFTQVSVNLVDYKKSSLYDIYSFVKEECDKNNIEIINSELIGMVLEEEVANSLSKYLKLDCNLNDRILKDYKFDYFDEPLDYFIERLSGKYSTPGGGSVSALSGTLGLGLINMVSNYTINKDKYKNVQDKVIETINKTNLILEKMKRLVNDDIEAYNKVTNAYKLSQETDPLKETRKKEINKTTYEASLPPYEMMLISYEGVKLIEDTYKDFNMMLISDFGVSVKLLVASFDSAYLNYIINYEAIKNLKEYELNYNDMNKKIEEMNNYIHTTGEKIYKEIVEIIKNS